MVARPYGGPAESGLMVQGGQEIAAEDGVKVVVDTVAAEHEVVPQAALAMKPQLFQYPLRAQVLDRAAGLDAIELAMKKQLGEEQGEGLRHHTAALKRRRQGLDAPSRWLRVRLRSVGATDVHIGHAEGAARDPADRGHLSAGRDQADQRCDQTAHWSYLVCSDPRPATGGTLWPIHWSAEGGC